MKCIKKLKCRGNLSLLLLCGSLTVFTGCGNDENYYDPNYAIKQYNANWENIMGQIDPNQTWNMAEAKTVKVTTSESGIVTVYSKDLDESYVLVKASVSAGTTSIKFDVPADMSEAYVVLSSQTGRTCETVSISGNEANVTFRGVKAVRALPASPKEREAIKYVYGYNYFPGWGGADATTEPVYGNNGWGTIYAMSDWNGDSKQLDGVYDVVELDKVYADVAANVKSMFDKAEGNQTLLKYTQNISYVTKSEGEISLTGLTFNSNVSSAIGYYYTEGNNTDLKGADKYILIPSTGHKIKGHQYKLVYYGTGGNGTPTYTFPANVKIHFFLARYYNGSGSEPEIWSDGKFIAANLQNYSDTELNEEIYALKGWHNVPVTAAFSTGGVNVVSFEDWGGNSATARDIDWNDCAFILNGDFDKFETIDKQVSWTLAFEDLGSTNDFDFNDVVIRITKNSTEQNGSVVSTTIDVDLCAAGGTLPTNVWFNNENLGEVHELFGVPTGTMVNTGNVEKDVVRLISGRTVGEGFTISDNARQFKIVVSGDATKEITLPGNTGVAPQAICIPGKWAWPTERLNIADAYTGFGAWGANYESNKDWYNTATGTVMVK